MIFKINMSVIVISFISVQYIGYCNKIERINHSNKFDLSEDFGDMEARSWCQSWLP